MMKMTLHDQERQQLEEIFKTTPDRRLRTRCQAILMASRGRPHRQMAEDLSISVRTLQRWLPADQARGLAGLQLRFAHPPHCPVAVGQGETWSAARRQLSLLSRLSIIRASILLVINHHGSLTASPPLALPTSRSDLVDLPHV